MMADVPLRWRVLSWLFAWLLAAYLVIVLPVDRAFPIINKLYVAPLLLIFGGWLVHRALLWLVWSRPGGEDGAKNVTVLAGMLLTTLLMVDVAFTAYSNVAPGFRFDQSRIFSDRLKDVHEWDSEIVPQPYAPTMSNFYLYKPGQRKAANVFGEDYYPELLQHAVLRESVLEKHHNEFIIDKYGLRNTEDPAQARIFALGDSFCFGYHTTQDATFVSLMSRQLGEPVYNMGVAGSSPMQQYLTLEYMLRTHPESFKPRRLLWLIFEGNDLEESYDLTFPAPFTARSPSLIFANTIVAGITDIPSLIRRESLIRLMTSGEIVLTASLGRRTATNHYELNGQTIAYPLYHSPALGYRLFRQMYLDRAGMPESYVRNHPNSPRLADAFARMQALAHAHNFDVTVVAIPSVPRLYKDAFEDLPPVSDAPHFLNYVRKLADDNGFAHVDLNVELAPYAKTELLYYRDDTHWNERGHQIVTELLLKHLAQAQHHVSREQGRAN